MWILKWLIYTFLGRKVVRLSEFYVQNYRNPKSFYGDFFVNKDTFNKYEWRQVQELCEIYHYNVQVYYIYKGIENREQIKMLDENSFITVSGDIFYYV